MGIDITKLKDDEMLEVLGEGDWHIAIEEGIPDIVVTVGFREECIDMVADWFVRWVKDGKDSKLNHSWDPHWDNSGSIRTSNADPMMLLIRHETLEGWLKQEYAGYSEATYASGHGLHWATFEDQYEDELQTKVFYLVRDAMYSYLGVDDPDEVDVDDFDEYYSYNMIEIYLVPVLIEMLCPRQTSDIWQEYEHAVQIKLEEERIEYEKRLRKHREMKAMAEEFWQMYFSQEIGQRIELPQFDMLEIDARLRDILADTDPEIVKAIAEIGWLGNCSNNVAFAIKYIANEALT